MTEPEAHKPGRSKRQRTTSAATSKERTARAPAKKAATARTRVHAEVPVPRAAQTTSTKSADSRHWTEHDVWRIELFGGLRVQRIRKSTAPSDEATGPTGHTPAPATGPVVAQFKRQKSAALLAFLAFNQQRPHSREVLIESLWPDMEPEVGRNSLRVTLSSLRAELEPEGVPRGSVLITNRSTIALNPAAITTDVAEFQACLQAAQHTGNSNSRIQLLADAVELYHGPLLRGMFESWVPTEEHHLSEVFYHALFELIAHLEQIGDIDRAIHYAQRGVSADPVREEAHRELMRLYASAGQPANVLRQYRELEVILKEQLNESPSPATRDLAQDIEHRLSRRRPVGASGRSDRQELAGSSGIITLMFTDIQGSTVLWEKVGSDFRAELTKHNRLIRRLVPRWSGQEIKNQGDSFMVSFERATDAIQCALEIQRALAQQAWLPEVGELLVRIGIHTGEPFQGYAPSGETDFFGPMVNRAARIADAGHGGQILISSATQDVVQGILATDAELVDLGHHLLRGLEEPQHLFEVRYCDPGSESPDAIRRFPPLRTLDTLRTNLPTFPSAFIGREQELQKLEELLGQRDTRLITLTGFGGMGKTRTALQLAELSAFKFADGAWWVDLEEARSGTAMMHRIAYHLGLKLNSRQGVHEQLEEYLQQRQVLLVLDNVEQIPDAAEVIKELLAGTPHVKCIVTSRHALDLRIEQRRELSPLPPPDAVQLFIERAGARSHFVLTDENAADVADLCYRLEGVPLAIELAASRTAGLSPREVLHRLSSRFRVLQSTSSDLPARQRVLRTTIDWSFDLLAPADKALFAQLAVFVGGFTMEHAEEVCFGFNVFESILELQRRSLLRTETDDATQQTHYSMLELLRDYAIERLRESPETEQQVRTRHAEYFLQYGRERMLKLRTPDEADALRQLESVFDNLRTATDWASGTQCHNRTAELALVLGAFLERRGFQREAMRHIRLGLEAARESDLKIEMAHLLQAQARLYLDQFDWPEAQHCATRALHLFEQFGDQRALATTTNLLGLAAKGEALTARQQGQTELAASKFAEAHRHYIDSLYRFTQLGDKSGIAIMHHNLGLIEYESGDRQSAHDHWQGALRLHRETGDMRGIAETLTNLGVLAQDHSDLQEAQRLYEQALQIEQELQNVFGVGRALSNLGEVAKLQNNLYRAWHLLTAALELFNRVETPYVQDTAKLLVETAALLECDTRTDKKSTGDGNSDDEQANDERSLASLDGKSVDELIAWAQGAPTST